MCISDADLDKSDKNTPETAEVLQANFVYVNIYPSSVMNLNVHVEVPFL